MIYLVNIDICFYTANDFINKPVNHIVEAESIKEAGEKVKDYYNQLEESDVAFNLEYLEINYINPLIS
jgi:FixJ family two-component response regulator